MAQSNEQTSEALAANEDFFESLTEVTAFEGVIDRRQYVEAPASWQVVIADVEGSTRAIEQGRYREVNAMGVACIVAVRNAVPDLQLPYVFGGDGATLLVPGSRLNEVDRALRGLRALSNSKFELPLRVGRVSVAELQRAGHPVKVARYRLSAHIALGMFSGKGITVAEAWIKDPARAQEFLISDGESAADLDGFECRWQPLPSQRGVVVSLLVVALAGTEQEQGATYAKVVAQLNKLVGDGDSAPVAISAMRLKGWFDDYSIEARLVGGSNGEVETARRRARRHTAIGRALTSLGASVGGFDGAKYKAEFLRNTDFRKFDETLRMVLDLTASEADALEAWLKAEHAKGTLAYGVQRADAALATCMVKAYQGDHVHFIDGADGGYALAAKSLKAQLSAHLSTGV